MHLTVRRDIPCAKEDELWDVVPTSAGLRSIPPHFFDYFWGGGKTAYDWHDGRTLTEFQLLYITKGYGVYQSHEAGTLDLSAGDLALVFPDVWHRYCPRKETGWREQWVMFRGAMPYRLLNNGIIRADSPVLHVGTGVIDDLWEELMAVIHQPEMGPTCLIGLNVALILTKALESVGVLASNREYAESGRERAIANAVTLIENQKHRSLDVAALAQTLGMSTRSLRRRFKELHGITPQDFHVRTRIKEAMALLRTSSARVNEIAEALGYADVHQFYRMFKKVIGATPTAYRNNLIHDNERGNSPIG